MHDPLPLALGLFLPAMALAFAAGLSWRDRRREREAQVFDLAICALEERVSLVEEAVGDSGERTSRP